MSIERVLLAEAVHVIAQRAAQRVTTKGGELVVVTSVAEARRACGTFDRGLFAFDLPDGSGIVLAAEMLLEDRIRDVGFLHPQEDPAP